MAVISQDARHLEVRDALFSPLGFIVVPAEAANRIVKQFRDGNLPRLANRNSLSFTSFLASFVAGSTRSAQEREDLGGTSSPIGSAAPDEGRQIDGQVADASPRGSTAISAPAQSPTTDPLLPKAIPAVNIVFLVDTLRRCRFAETRSAPAASQAMGQQREGKQSVPQAWRDHRLLGLSDTSAARVATHPLFEGFGKRGADAAAAQFSFGSGGAVEESSCLPSNPKPEPRCLCKTANESSAAARGPVLHASFADVLLLCADGFEILSHRALLAARCSFFEARLTRPHWEACRTDKVNLLGRERGSLVVIKVGCANDAAAA